MTRNDLFPQNPKQGDLVKEDDGMTTWMWNESENFVDHRPSQWVLVYRPDKTDDEVRAIIEKICSGSAGQGVRELGEEIIDIRRRLAQLENR